MNSETALGKALAGVLGGQVPQCIAAGYIDLAQGVLLELRTSVQHPKELIDLLGAAAGDQMQGKTVRDIEDVFAQLRGRKVERYITRFSFLTQGGFFHLCMRCQKQQDHAVMFVCSPGVNEGMATAKAQLAMRSIEAAF